MSLNTTVPANITENNYSVPSFPSDAGLNTSVPAVVGDNYAVPSLPIESISGKEDKANKGVANGYAPLDANAKIPSSSLANPFVLPSGGSIDTTHGAEGAGGSINTSNGGGSIDTSGATDFGGSINTSDGGGSINTRGAGSVQLGVGGTRTTLNGSATFDRTITLPNQTGTLVLASQAIAFAIALG